MARGHFHCMVTWTRAQLRVSLVTLRNMRVVDDATGNKNAPLHLAADTSDAGGL